MHVTVWRVPFAALPASLHAALPRRTRPLRLRGQVLVGTAFVRYEPGGILSYDELLAAVLVRHRGGLRITIGDIWVDSPASVAGGRSLWGIPKHLASFRRETTTAGRVTVAATRDGVTLAELRTVPGPALPGWHRTPMPTAQRLDGVETVTSVQSLARARFARTAWRFPSGSPLRWVADGRPVASLRLEPLVVSFGSAGGSARR